MAEVYGDLVFASGCYGEFHFAVGRKFGFLLELEARFFPIEFGGNELSDV